MLINHLHRQYYLRHRERVKNAQSKTDDRSPKIDARYFIRSLSGNYECFKYIRDANIALIEAINRINCTRGAVDSFRTESTIRFDDHQDEANMDHIEKMNRRLGEIILGAKAITDCWNSKTSLLHTRKQREELKYAEEVMEKYTNLKLPKSMCKLQLLLRPVIYLHIGLKNQFPFGRLGIELYTEASPQVVLEFVRFAHSGNTKRLRIRRLFPDLWLECELHLRKDTLLKDNKIEYDYRALDHDSSAGILSYSLKFVRPSEVPVLNFSISFKPIVSSNMKRVAFGRVIEGKYALDILQDYGTKNGKPVREMVCHGCSLKQPRFKPKKTRKNET